MKNLPSLICGLCIGLVLAGCSTDTPASAAADTNPYLGRVLIQEGAKAGIHTNARLGGGAAGNVGNE